MRVCTVRALAIASQSLNWVLKSGGNAKVAARHEGGFEGLVASLHDALRLRVAWPQPMQGGWPARP